MAIESQGKPFKNREERQKCYSARDLYFDCVESQPAEQADPKQTCKQLYSQFESLCGIKWTEHFVRRRDYLKFKEKIEKDGVESIDQLKFK